MCNFQFPFNLPYSKQVPSTCFSPSTRVFVLLENVKQKKKKKVLPVICQRSGCDNSRYDLPSPGKPLGIKPWVPGRLWSLTAGSCLGRPPPPATLQSLLQALRQVLSVPRGGRSKAGRPPGIQPPGQLLGSRTEDGMLPPVPVAPSFFPEGPGGSSKFVPAGEPPRAPSERRGAAGCAGGGRGGGGRGREVGDPEGEERERGLGATFLQTTLPHAETTEI